MTTLDATDSTGLALRIRFTRERDRYAHAILAVEPSGREHLLLESVEGTPEDEFPPSPPLQSLSIEELAPGRRAALLVGMAGRSHWSASIEAVPGIAALVFDIACRVANDPSLLYARTSGPVSLFSHYRSAECPIPVIIAENSRRESIHFGLTLFPMHATQHSVISPNESALHAPTAERLYGRTVRWQYCAELNWPSQA